MEDSPVKLCIGITHAGFLGVRRAMLSDLMLKLGKSLELVEGRVYVANDFGERVIWKTCRRAMLAPLLFPDATHLLYLQDDTLVCRDFIETVIVHATMKPGAVMSYMSYRAMIGWAIQQKKAWAWTPDHLCAAAVLMPRDVAVGVVRWADQVVPVGFRYDDMRITQYVIHENVRGIWCPVPNLVENASPEISADGLLHPDQRGRLSHTFIGEGRSGLEVDWSAGEFEPVTSNCLPAPWTYAGIMKPPMQKGQLPPFYYVKHEAHEKLDREVEEHRAVKQGQQLVRERLEREVEQQVEGEEVHAANL